MSKALWDYLWQNRKSSLLITLYPAQKAAHSGPVQHLFTVHVSHLFDEI
jgi:hypothetical protein